MYNVVATMLRPKRATEISAPTAEPDDRQRSTGLGELLLRHRLAAGMTRDELAERAGLRRRSIQGLEQGENQPHRDTVQRLAVALGLSETEWSRARELAQPSPRRPRWGRSP